MSGKDYKQVLKVWNKFEKKTMKDYHYLHLKCDVLFLADIRNRFELGYNAQYVKSRSWTYFRCRHVFVLWERYER